MTILFYIIILESVTCFLA